MARYQQNTHLAGPAHQLNLFVWAWRHASAEERRWMLAEAIGVAGLLGLAGYTRLPAAWLYIALVTAGAWLYPLATVWWPHRGTGETPFEHTRLFRGRWVPALFLQHTYHLEHHLYPMVASANWQRLSQRLDPILAERQIKPILLP